MYTKAYVISFDTVSLYLTGRIQDGPEYLPIRISAPGTVTRTQDFRNINRWC